MSPSFPLISQPVDDSDSDDDDHVPVNRVPAINGDTSFISPQPPSRLSNVDSPLITTLKATTVHTFSGQSGGPRVTIPQTPLEIFRLFYTPEIVQMIVDESNKYAEQNMPSEKFETWEKISVEDFEVYIGFSIKMGFNKLPSLHHYWSDDITFRYRPVADRISRDRYFEISRYLHYADNTTLPTRGQPGYDRLCKVCPLIEKLQERFSAVYSPGRNLAVDEAMIKFQGRSAIKQYMPKKPIKRGIKVWVLGDSKIGYFSRLEVYLGKKEGVTEHNLGARVVKDLTTDFQNKWHRVYFDNFSPPRRSSNCNKRFLGCFLYRKMSSITY